MGKLQILAELWQFLRHRKIYWLLPLIITLLIFGLFIVFTESTAVAPFIYAIF